MNRVGVLAVVFALCGLIGFSGCFQSERAGSPRQILPIDLPPPGDYLENASAIETLQAFLAKPPISAIDCEPGRGQPIEVEPISNQSPLLSLLFDWFLTCNGPIVGGIWTAENPSPTERYATQAIRNGTENELFATFQERNARLYAEFDTLAARPVGNVVERQIHGMAQFHLAGLDDILRRSAARWPTYEERRGDVQLLESLLSSQYMASMDAESILGVLEAYPWTGQACPAQGLEEHASRVLALINQTESEGRKLDGFEDSHGGPLNRLQDYRAQVRFMVNRTWSDGLYYIEMKTEWIRLSAESYGMEITPEQATSLIHHKRATNRTLFLEELTLGLENLAASERNWNLNPTAGARVLALAALGNPAVRDSCDPAA